MTKSPKFVYTLAKKKAAHKGSHKLFVTTQGYFDHFQGKTALYT